MCLRFLMFRRFLFMYFRYVSSLPMCRRFLSSTARASTRALPPACPSSAAAYLPKRRYGKIDRCAFPCCSAALTGLGVSGAEGGSAKRHICFNGRVLPPGATLLECDVRPRATLDLVIEVAPRACPPAVEGDRCPSGCRGVEASSIGPTSRVLSRASHSRPWCRRRCRSGASGGRRRSACESRYAEPYP